MAERPCIACCSMQEVGRERRAIWGTPHPAAMGRETKGAGQKIMDGCGAAGLRVGSTHRRLRRKVVEGKG